MTTEAHATLMIDTADAMRRLGACLAAHVRPGASIWLQGELGTGKTTLCRGFIRASGYQGRVKSPSYTLIESYQTENFPVHHFDFYRMTEAVEVEWIGVRDYFHPGSVCLIEWPERAGDYLPSPVLRVVLTFDEERRRAALYAAEDFPLAGVAEAFGDGRLTGICSCI